MKALARRNGAGPRSAERELEALFEEHAPMVLAICRYHLREREAAEDAAQETFLSAHRALLGGSEPRDPAAWLATIARNQCRRTWRTTAHTGQLTEHTAATLLDPADIVADRSELSEVATAIAGLPARQREALVLRELWGLSYEQVAAAMSVSAAAVDSLLSRARRRVVDQFGEIPKAARGAILVPGSLREELARLVPGFDTAGAATAAGGAAALASVGSAPFGAKAAATGVAAMALVLPVQSTVRVDGDARAGERRSAPRIMSAAPVSEPVVTPRPVRSATKSAPRGAAPTRPVRVAAPRRVSRPPAPAPSPEPVVQPPASGSDSSGSGSSGSGSSGSGSSGSGSSGSGSSGSGSSGSGSSGSGSGSDNSGSGSDSSGSGSGGSGSDSDNSGSGSDSSGSGSGGSGSDSDNSGSGSDSSGSGSGGSGSGGGDDDD